MEAKEAEFDHLGQGGGCPRTGVAQNGEGEGVGGFLQGLLPTNFILLLELAVGPQRAGGGEFQVGNFLLGQKGGV